MTKNLPKEGEVVTGTLVTGERFVGFYGGRKPTTGSYLINQVTTEHGETSEYAWAESIDERFDNGLAQGLGLGA